MQSFINITLLKSEKIIKYIFEAKFIFYKRKTWLILTKKTTKWN